MARDACKLIYNLEACQVGIYHIIPQCFNVLIHIPTVSNWLLVCRGSLIFINAMSCIGKRHLKHRYFSISFPLLCDLKRAEATHVRVLEPQSSLRTTNEVK